MMTVEEIGARLVLFGKTDFVGGMREVRKELTRMGADGKAAGDALVSASDKAGAAAAKAVADLAKAEAALSEATAAYAASGTAAADVRMAQAQGTRDAALANAVAADSALAASAADTTAAAAADARTAAHGRLIGSVNKLGKLGLFTGIATGLGLSYEGLKNMSSLTAQMTKLHTLANVPLTSLPALQTWIVKNSPNLLQSTSVIADQMYRIASAAPGISYSTTQLQQMTTAAADLAAVMGPKADPESIARIFGIVRAAGGLGTGTGNKSYRKTAAIAAATVGAGDMTGADFVSALGSGGLVEAMQQFHVTLSQAGAVLANLGDLGINGSMAGHAFQHSLSLMGAPVSGPTRQVFGAIGLQPDAIGMTMRTKGLLPAITQLHSHLSGSLGEAGAALVNQMVSGSLTKAQRALLKSMGLGAPTSLTLNAAAQQQAATKGLGSMGPLGQQIITMLEAKMFGGAKQSTPVIAMLNSLPREGGKLGEINAGIKNFAANVALAKNTPEAMFKRLDLDMMKVANTLGEFLLPKLVKLFGWMSKHKEVVKTLAIAIGTVLVAAIVIYTASMIDAAIATVAATWPILAIMAAVAAIGVGIYELVKHWKQAWHFIQRVTKDVWDWILNHILIVWDAINAFLTGAWKDFAGGASNVWNGIKDTILGVWDAVRSGISRVWDGIKADAKIGVTGVTKVINFFIRGLNAALGWAGVHIGLIGVGGGVGGGGAAVSAAGTLGGQRGSTRFAPGMAGGGTLGIGPGFVTDGPRAIVGEGRPQWPEYVIPSDPAHRANALSLFHQLGAHLAAAGGSSQGGGWSLNPFKDVAKIASDVYQGGQWLAGQAVNLALQPAELAARQMIRLMPAGMFRQVAKGVVGKLVAWANEIVGGSPAKKSAGGASTIAAPATSTGGSNQALMQRMAAPYGWSTGPEWNALYSIEMAEAGFNQFAKNPTSSAYGMAQAIGGPAAYGPNYNDPGTQIAWMLNYIQGRYGDPIAGWAHESSMHWYEGGGLLTPRLPVYSYDAGGSLPVGASIALNGTGSPEAIPAPGSGEASPLVVQVVVDRKVLGSTVIRHLQDRMARR